MKTIRVISSTSTNLDPALASASTIEVEDAPLGQGKFGIAYRADRFDGKQVSPQVVKLLTGNRARHGLGTVQELQKRLRAANTKASSPLLQALPALRGVPQLSFEGTLEGQQVLGYSANDLSSAGFDEFQAILDDRAKYKTFQALPVSSKMRLARELVAAFQFLSSEIRFIHADMKAEALFLDLSGAHCAVIDFDSGALARNASDTPTTYGTRQDWLAPEIISQLNAPGNGSVIKVNLQSDVWSINIAIHYLIFGLHPLFFLKEISDRSIDAYFKQFTWPDVAPAFPYFRPDVAAVYPKYRDFAKRAVPAEVMKRLAYTIGNGFRDPNQRTTYDQWQTALTSLNQSRIRSFVADRVLVQDGRPVHLTWDVVGAAKLELTNQGDVTGKTSVDVVVTQDTVYELTLTAATGAKVTKKLAIAIDKRPPDITSFVTSAALLTNATPARLEWQVTCAARLQIDNGVGDVTLSNHVDVLPRTGTTYTLTATSYFGVVATASVEVRVSNAPPAITFFRADAAVLEKGRPVTLSWQVSADAYEVTINGIGVGTSGSKTVDQRRPHLYQLTATSFFGPQSEARVYVDIVDPPPTIHEFRVSPPLVRHGDAVVLSWDVTGAERVRLDPEGIELPASGSQTLRPERSQRLVLKASSWYGSVAERSMPVTVIRKPSLQDVQQATRERRQRYYSRH